MRIGGGVSGFEGSGIAGELSGERQRPSITKNADAGGVFAVRKSREKIKWFCRKKSETERNGKKLIREGIDEADYACYALRKYGIRPKEWIEMDMAERMFFCAVEELEIEYRQRQSEK